MNRIRVFSPAKLNLFLAITGPRADGYHDLVSLASPLAWGDHLSVEAAEVISLACNDPAVPLDASNLILKAAEAFRAATGWKGGAAFSLEKRIPIGAGLGGGSSNAVAALLALEKLSGIALEASRRREIAAGLGSDCVLFLLGGPAWMRGRGEAAEAADASTASRLRSRRVAVFAPGFGISTPWAYGRMRSDPRFYLSAAEAEARVGAWKRDPRSSMEALLFNNMEGPAFEKFPALPLLLARLRADFGLAPRMSGSGSACFAFLRDRDDFARMGAAIRAAWGPSALILETNLL